MNQEDLECKLLANLPIPLDKAGYIYIPTFREVSEIGLSSYNQLLAQLIIDKAMLRQSIDDSITNFDVFYANCYHDEDFKNRSLVALRMFFRSDVVMTDSLNEAFFIIGDDGRLDHSNFDSFQHVIKTANHIKLEKEPEFKPGNSKAQEMINAILKNRKKQPKPKEKMDLVSIVTALAWKQNGLNIFNVFDLNIFQIYNGFYITNNIDNYHHTLTGMYAGTIDGKNIKMSDIHWANKVNT